MGNRNIYIHSQTNLRLRIIDDHTMPANKQSWQELLRPDEIPMFVDHPHKLHINCSPTVKLVDLFGNALQPVTLVNTGMKEALIQIAMGHDDPKTLARTVLKSAGVGYV